MSLETKRSEKESGHSGQSLRRGGGCLLVVMLFILLYYGAYFLMRGQLPASPEVIAHRGAHKGKSGKVPENTLAAFRNAIELGADRLEMDVQMTKDGYLVVIHDETVQRTANQPGQVAEMTLAQIRTLDVGDGEKIPTFKEVIDLARDAGIPIMPEAKSPHLYPGLAEKMIQHLVDENYVDGTVIQSFNGATLDSIRALHPDISVCALHGLGEVNTGDPQPGEANIVCPMAEMAVLYPWMIRQAHSAGHQVFVWFGVIEHPLVMRFLLALGADGLMVDDTASLTRVLGRQ